jgi:hypothetical protein
MISPVRCYVADGEGGSGSYIFIIFSSSVLIFPYEKYFEVLSPSMVEET